MTLYVRTWKSEKGHVLVKADTRTQSKRDPNVGVYQTFEEIRDQLNQDHPDLPQPPASSLIAVFRQEEELYLYMLKYDLVLNEGNPDDF